jgi:hypothetical protein
MQTLSLEGFGDDVSLEGHNHDLAGLVIVSDDSLIQIYQLNRKWNISVVDRQEFNIN